MADSLVQRLEQLIGQWREQIASDVTTITQLDNEADPGWTMQQSLAWRYGRQTECVEALADVCRAWQAEQGWRDIAKERDLLRAALVKLVGSDGKEELEQMEVVMRTLPAPAEDKAATIDAIHALIATLPVPSPPGTEA